MADQNIYTNITATANFTSLTAQLRAVTAELIKLQATTIGLDRNLSNEVGRMNRAFADTMRATGQFSSHFVTLESDVQKFGKRLDTGRMKLGEYYGVWQGHARKTSTLIKDLAKQQVLMEQAVLQPLGRNAQGQMQYNVHVANGLDVLKNRTALLRQESAILNKVMLDGSNQLINWGKNTQWAGRQLTVGLTVPMMAFGAAAQKAFLEADQQLVRLTKVYGGLGETSAAELKQVRDDVAQTAKELASIYGASYKETIALAADIAATGKQGNDLLVSTQETTRLAILGEVDRQDAMKATLAIQNAFKQSNEELAESINFLNAVENQTSTSLADLVEAIPKAGPVIESLGGDIQDLALYLTAMKEGGVNASEGANAIKSSLASLINPTKVAKEMFRGFGIDLEGIVTNNAGDITRTILELQGALDKLDPLQKSQAIEQLFGKFQFARMGALFNNLGKQGSQTLQVLDLMKASTEDLAGIADRELKAMTESASGQYKRALESIKADLASVGDQFLKISTFVLKTISGILKFVENLPAPIKSLLTFLGGLTAFAGPLIMLTGVLGNFLGYIIKGVFHLKQLFKGGSGFKLLTPEMMAAAEAGRVVEKSFFSDAQAAIALETAVNNLAASFDRLKTSALNSAVATSSSISTMGGSTILSPAGTAANADRMADKNSPYIGSPYSRQFAHTIPSATEQPGTIFGVVPNPGPVNVRVGKNPQMYMDDDLPRIPGVTSISGVSTGIVAGEAAKWHAMTAAIATQSQAELSLLKTEVAATGTVTHELSSVYQAMLPQMQQLTALAADEGRMIVQQLQQGVITVDQARAKIISLNATIEIMMAETAAQVAAGMGRGINLTTVPFTSQPVVDPVTGKSNMKEMFHKPETASLVDDVARGLGVRTSGGGYSIETTKPRIILPKRGPIRGFNDGGYVYTLADGPLVPGDKNVNYDNTMARIPEGGFVLNQEATKNNPQLVDYAKRTKPYNRGGMIDAMLTPYETVFTPEQTQEMLPILEAANSGQRIQFRNAGGILGGPIVSGKHNYGRFDLLRSLFRRKPKAVPGEFADDFANVDPAIKLGKSGGSLTGEQSTDVVARTMGVGRPVRSGSPNKPQGYFFVGNWGLNVTKGTNSALDAGGAKILNVITDIESQTAAQALPALRRFLKVNGVKDDVAETLLSKAQSDILDNLRARATALADTVPAGRPIVVGERDFTRAQHPVYLEIAESLGLRKQYIDSLGIPGQRRGFVAPEDRSSRGADAPTAIRPFSISDVDKLIEKNQELGTSFMGSYVDYNEKGYKIGGKEAAFAHMKIDEFAMGGIIGKNKANYGRLFLGMPKSIKQVQEQRKRKQVMEQTTEAVNSSRFAKDEPTNFGKLEEETTGHSFPVGGIGGVYTKPDGTKVFVKPVLDEKAALAEQRYNVIHKDAHELEPPKQEVRVMIDPTDPAGKRKLLVLESPYDPKFAKMPEKMTEDEYFKQLLASALRGDKDLSRGNVGGSLVPDAGTSGVFKTASGLRDYADDMPSVAEQARINLLGVKGGAKKFFAESTIDIPKGMTAEQYHDRMLAEIDYVLPRLKEIVSGPKLGLNKDEQPFYDAIVKRLEDARHVNWKEFHGIHSAVKPTSAKAMTPAALAKIEEALALKQRQKGHAASLSDMAFKSDANGFNGGGLINLIKSMAMKRIGAGFGKDTKGGWGVTSLEIGMAEKLFASTGLTKRTQRILYDKFAEQLAKEMPYGYAKNAQGHLVKALEPSIIDSVVRMAASSTLSAPEGRRILSTIDRDILRKKFANWESRKDTPLTKTLQELIFKLEGREKGEPVSGNTPYIVGEKGPELFVPMNNGGIIPNHALGGMIRTGKYNYGALGPIAGIVAQQALPLAAFMLLPKALEKLGIASEKSNLILNGIFLAITAGSIYGGVKRAKAAKAAAAAGSVADDAAGTVAASKGVSKFTQSLAKLRLVGMAIPGWGKVAIVALTTLATVSYGAWENARKARLASQEAFDVNEKQAKQLGIAYVSLSDKIKNATEAAQKNSQLTKLKAAGSTAIGGGINMSIKELNALQKKAKETQGDIVEMFNNLDENDVTKAATALKVQLVAAGKSAQDAAREIYSIISVSNKAAQATEAVSSTEFLKVVDRASAARVAIETFVKSMNFGDVDKKEIASSFSGGLDAIQLYYQSLVGVKDAGGKAKTQVEALNDTIAHMNANKANQQEIGEDILNTLIKENPLYQDILNKNDSMVDAWAKIQLYTNGVTADLSDISGEEAQGLLQVVNAISQAATEMTTNANLMNNPIDAIAEYGVTAKKAYEDAKKASDDATKNAQKNADAEIKALDKKIEKINEEADARIRAIEDQAEKQDYLTEVQKEQINYQQALLAGDMSRAAQSQLNIQGLTNERQKSIAIDAINDKRNADVKKLEQQKVGIQERLVKLQEKANKLQEAANVAQKEYAAVQALQQSIATTLSKASITTDEASLPILAEALRSDVAALAALGKDGAKAAKSITAAVPVTKGTTITTPGGQPIVQPGKQDWLTYLKSLTNNPGGPADSAIEYAKTYFEKFGTHVEDFGLYVKTLTGLDVVGGTRTIKPSELRGEIKTNSDPRKTEYFAADGTSLGKGFEARTKYYANPDKPMSGEAYIYPNSKVNRGGINGVMDISAALWSKGIKTPLTQDGLTYQHNGSVTKGGKIVGYWGYNIDNVGFKSYATGGSVKNFEWGGNVTGPGTATSDSIPAWLSDGEYVIKASSVDKYGKEFFDGLNTQKFANGGPVGINSSIPLNSGYLNSGGMIPEFDRGGMVLKSMIKGIAKFVSGLFGKKPKIKVPSVAPKIETPQLVPPVASPIKVSSPLEKIMSDFYVQYGDGGLEAFHVPSGKSGSVGASASILGSGYDHLSGGYKPDVSNLPEIYTLFADPINPPTQTFKTIMAAIAAGGNRYGFSGGKLPLTNSTDLSTKSLPILQNFILRHPKFMEARPVLTPQNQLADHGVSFWHVKSKTDQVKAEQEARKLGLIDAFFNQDPISDSQKMSIVNQAYSFDDGRWANMDAPAPSNGEPWLAAHAGSRKELNDLFSMLMVKWKGSTLTQLTAEQESLLQKMLREAIQDGQIGTGTFSSVLRGYPQLANGGLIQKFGTGGQPVPNPGPGRLPYDPKAVWKNLDKKTLMKLGGKAGAVWGGMEELEKYLSLKHGANPNSSGFSKWTRAIGRVLFNTAQGTVAGAVGGRNAVTLFGGMAAGLVEGLAGIIKDGSAYGVKGGSYADPKGAKTKRFDPAYHLDAMGPSSVLQNIAWNAGAGSALSLPLGYLSAKFGPRIKEFANPIIDKIKSKLTNKTNIAEPVLPKLNVSPEILESSSPFNLSNKALKKAISEMYKRKNITEGDYSYPAYTIGESKDTIVFKGMGEDLSSLQGKARIVETKPEALLEEALRMNPGDENLMSMLENFRANTPGQVENDFLDSLLASVSVSKKGKMQWGESTDGFAMLLSALSGNKNAANFIKHKTAVFKRVRDYYDQVPYSNKPITPEQLALLEQEGIDMSQIPFIHSTQYPIMRDESGEVFLKAHGDWQVGAETPYARSTIHSTLEAPVATSPMHMGANDKWEGTNSQIITTLQDMFDANGNPASINATDTWYHRNPGQPLRMPNAIVTTAFTNIEKYKAELIKRGLIKEGEFVPPVIADEKSKEILKLLKKSYTEEERELIASLDPHAYQAHSRGEMVGNETEWVNNVTVQEAKRLRGIHTRLPKLSMQQIDGHEQRTIEAISRLLGIKYAVHQNSHAGLFEKGEIKLPGQQSGDPFDPTSYPNVFGYGSQTKTGKWQHTQPEMLRYLARLGHFKTQIKWLNQVEDDWNFGGTSDAAGGLVPTGSQKKTRLLPRFNSNGERYNIPKFETGINMVPADMLAMLHKNEAVVPANMNPFNPNANNATMGGGVYNITNNINGADCDINELSDIVTRKTIESMKTISTLNMKTVGQNRSLGSSLEVRV